MDRIRQLGWGGVFSFLSFETPQLDVSKFYTLHIHNYTFTSAGIFDSVFVRVRVCVCVCVCVG